MKFLKTIAIDILMIPVIIELGCKCLALRDIEITDDYLSPYAKWVADLAGKYNDNSNDIQI